MGTNISFAAEIFNKKFSSLQLDMSKRIEFKEKFKEDFGYLDPVVQLVSLEQGEEKWMIDDINRRCILFGTLFGTVVVFQRYTDKNTQWGCNYPQELHSFGLYTGSNAIFGDSAGEYLYQIIGEHNDDNIGNKLKNLLEYADKIRLLNFVENLQPSKDS